jgi:hypothetical protein
MDRLLVSPKGLFKTALYHANVACVAEFHNVILLYFYAFLLTGFMAFPFLIFAVLISCLTCLFSGTRAIEITVFVGGNNIDMDIPWRFKPEFVVRFMFCAICVLPALTKLVPFRQHKSET